MASDVTVWGIHAGRDGEADPLFMSGSIAVGWDRIADLSAFKDRTAMKAEVKSKYPEKKPNAIPGLAGVLFRLASEMAVGDYVVYPRKDAATVTIGRITGPYRYVPSAAENYAHQRPVEWLKEVPRLTFSLGARQEIGSALTLFKVRTYAEEFLAALKGETKIKKPPEFVGADLATESTEEYVRKRISERLKGKPFEQLVAHMFRVMGYHAVLDPEGPSGPYDIRAGKGPLGIEPPLLKIECKSAEEAAANQKDIMQLAHISAQSGHHGVFVSLAGFKKDAEPKFGGSPVTLAHRRSSIPRASSACS